MPGQKASERTAVTRCVARQLRADRAAAGLTQGEAASLTGLSKNTVGRMEKGLRVVDSEQVGRFCSAYRTDLGRFWVAVQERLDRGEGVLSPEDELLERMTGAGRDALGEEEPGA